MALLPAVRVQRRGAPVQAPHGCASHADQSDQAEARKDWQQAVLKIRTSNEEFYRFFHQAIDDMAALRLPIEGTDHMVFVPAAGLPWFMAPFGRDSLIVSLQNMMVYPEFARGALDVLGRWQATERDEYRDAEPGKIMHELRYGELAHFQLIPHTPYYGTADATPLYLITLHAAWRATGDQALLERHLPNAEAALAWIDNDGDRDGDLFQEYATRSPVGYENMAWKDAGDSMTYADGTQVRGPKALCELQGYTYDAWLRMAELYEALHRPDRAAELRAKAAALFAKFNQDFWDEATGFYAYMLDGDKRKVMTVASNPGHLLWSGLVPPDRAARVVARLMAPDMNSGWGIRTLSATHPAYNPYPTRTAPSGPTTTASSRSVSSATVSQRKPRRSPVRSVARRATSSSTSCRNSMPACSAAARVSRCSISVPTCRRPGLRGRASRCCRRCWASSRTRPTTGCTSIPRCRPGCPTSRCTTCASAAGTSISGSNGWGR